MQLSATLAGEPVTIHALPWPAEERRWDRFLAKAVTDADCILGYDVESTTITDTGVLDPDARLRLMQFATYDEAWVLDPHDPFWRPRIEALLRVGEFRFVSHTNFDPLWARREFGIDLDDLSIDTMPMACLVYPGNPPVQRQRHGLKELCAALGMPELAEGEQALFAEFKRLAPVGHRAGIKAPSSWGYSNIPLTNEIWCRYAGLDAIAVRRLLDILAHKLAKLKMKRLSRREQRIQRLATGMQWRGHLVDEAYTEARLGEIEGDYIAADERLTELFGFSPRSTEKRSDWFLERGVDGKRTGTGMLQLTMPGPGDPGTLVPLAERYAEDAEVGPVLADLVVLGERKNLMDNLKGLLRLRDANGRVHPRINIDQAVTGRMSIVEPALQTFKKEDKRLRGCLLSDPGWVLVRADYDNQEVRLGAAFSGDRALLKIVREHLNQHELTCVSLFGAGTEADHDGMFYKRAKVMDFAQQYGAGPRRIAEQLGISERKAYAMWQRWRGTYAGLVAWTDDEAQNPVVINAWGRRIPRDKWRHYANGNYKIQSSGRDMLGDAIIALDEAGWTEALWLPMHDEIILHVREDEAEDAAEALEAAMYTVLQGTEFTAESKILGRRWSGE